MASNNIPPQFAQLKADRATFQKQAKTDGLNLQNVRQQALSSLPANATTQQKHAAVQAAIQQAVQQANDPGLTQDFSKLQQDRAQMKPKGPHSHGGKPPAAGNDQSVQSIIAEGSSASVTDIQSALSGMSSTDPNYATLQAMLISAQAQQSQQPNNVGNNLNFMG